MASIPDVQYAKFLLFSYGGWFGPPLVEWQGTPIDGRKRLAGWTALSMLGKPPTTVATDLRSAARLVLLAGHADRAYSMLGASIPYDATTAALLRVPPEVGASLVAQHRRARRRPRKAPRRREQVVKRLRSLYLECSERGRELKLNDLREVLDDWA